MIVVDANVLLYAVNRADPHHDEAAGWLQVTLDSSEETLGMSWIVLVAFLRLATRPGIFPRPLPPAVAVSLVEEWLAHPVTAAVEPTGRHIHVLRGLLASTGTGGNLVNDAHLAALALEHDATVVTYDNDFDRFDGVRWRRPVASAGFSDRR